jgi:hypothetical protein
MRTLAEAWPGEEFVQQPVAQLPWSHVVTLLRTMKGFSHMPDLTKRLNM